MKRPNQDYAMAERVSDDASIDDRRSPVGKALADVTAQ
jgi:hypothetical protein